MKLFLSALFALALTAAQASAQSAQLSGAWLSVKGTEAQCIANVRLAFEQAKFTNPDVVGSTVFADHEPYGLAVTCVESKEMLFIFGGGPKAEAIGQYVTEMQVRLKEIYRIKD